jgi:sortase A
LSAPAQGVELLVLAGDSGNALAFGPGLALASARPGTAGTTVIAGHRDTHFSFLAKLVEGDVRRYQVGGVRVVDAARETISMLGSEETLLLVTCYPFDALWAGGGLRYTVGALPLASVSCSSCDRWSL